MIIDPNSSLDMALITDCCWSLRTEGIEECFVLICTSALLERN